MRSQIKRKIYYIIEIHPHSNFISRLFNYIIVTLVSLNIIVMILETQKTFFSEFPRYFVLFDDFSAVVFTIEYFLRIWTSDLHRNYHRPIIGRIKFALTPMLIIDFLSFLPLYLHLFFPGALLIDLRFIRIFRIFKLIRYSKSIRLLNRVIKSKRTELFTVLVIVFLSLIIVSSLMFFIESKFQPDKFGSILDAMWWAVCTLTTLGYGDVYPITPLGKLLGGFVSVLGIGIFALPAGLLSSGFIEEMKKNNSDTIICPHCKKEFDK